MNTNYDISPSHNISPSVFSSAVNVKRSNDRSSVNDSNNIKFAQFGGIKEEQSDISSSEDFDTNRDAASHNVSEQLRAQISRDMTSDNYRCRFQSGDEKEQA